MISWNEMGPVVLDEASRLQFPQATHTPAIYRFKFEADEFVSFYVGETIQCSRRFQHYRTPGPSQQTNKRLNREMIVFLRDRGRITVQMLEIRSPSEGEVAVPPRDLYEKNVRTALEREAINDLRRDGHHLRNR